MGWFCTPDSCKGADQMVHVIKSLSADVLSANMPIDFGDLQRNVSTFKFESEFASEEEDENVPSKTCEKSMPLN